MDNCIFTIPSATNEIWKAIQGFEGFYEVSNFGRVRRIKPAQASQVGRILKPRHHVRGYHTVNLYKLPKTPITRYIHRLVYEAFVGVIPIGYEINHIDANKTNNQLSNLECVTREENIKHAKINKLFQQGDNHYFRQKPEIAHERVLHMIANKPRGRKLSEALVKQIREELKTETVTTLSKKYEVTKTVISAIKHNRIWKE